MTNLNGGTLFNAEFGIRHRAAPYRKGQVLHSVFAAAWINRHVLSNRCTVWIGLISFPLYLWHWPLLSFARIIQGEVPSAEIRISAVMLAVVLAWLTYALVEKPLKSNDHKFKTAVLLVAMASIASFGYYIYNHAGISDRSSVKASNEFNSQFIAYNWKYSTNETCMTNYPLADSEKYSWWFCMASKTTPPNVLITGSSFANHLYPGFANNDELNGNSILNVGACSVDITNADVTMLSKVAPNSPCAGTGPKDQERLIRNIITTGKSIKYAVISGLRRQQTPESIASIEETVSFMKANGVKPIVFVPHVVVYRDLKGCFSRPFRTTPTAGCEVEAGARAEITAGFAPLVESLSKSNPDVPIFDQNDMYCDSEKCSLVVDGMPLFRDKDGHYSEYASEKLGKLFATWAETNAPGLISRGQ